MKKLLIILVLIAVAVVAGMLMQTEAPSTSSDTSASISEELNSIAVDDYSSDFRELDSELLNF